MSGEPVEREVLALQHLDLEGLRSEWRARFGPPPTFRSARLLRLHLAWRIQAHEFGGIAPELRRQLKRKGAPRPEGLSLGAGAVLRREWQGRLVEVVVEERGFLWNGTAYKSLSAAATAIAGTRWNGPRFFGLRKAAP